MAILIDFQKVREDSQEVEYAFGNSGDLNRRLVVQKSSQEASPLDGSQDKAFARVFLKIVQYHQTHGRWPEKGAYQA